VRFGYIARHRARFEHRILSEMLAQIGPDFHNAFWDHYGGKVTGLSFREADQLSTHDKEFIRTLFPDAPLFLFLLPEKVRDAIGQVGDATRGAVRLLERAGMRFLNEVDPFDAGPYYGARVEELKPVKAYRAMKAAVGQVDGNKARSYLVARDDAKGFRAVHALATVAKGRIVVSKEVLKASTAARATNSRPFLCPEINSSAARGKIAPHLRPPIADCIRWVRE